MKVDLDWLRDFVKLDASLDEIGERLTLAGIEAYPEVFGIVAAEVVEAEKHPNADKLWVCKVWDGVNERQVVCGAPNTRAGMKTALVTPGAVLPDGTEVKAANLRGVSSDGMLCSWKELGISDDHSGIVELDPSIEPGGPVHERLADRARAVIELDLTPNRGDCLSHLGVARELSALFKLDAVHLDFSLNEDGSGRKAGEQAVVEVTAPEKCPRYCARVIEGVEIGPSPEWVQRRLEAVGIRSINNVVDATNYVLMELGQPLHAFDLDKLSGSKIVVRTAREGEEFKTLDGVERILSQDDLVIADTDKAVAIAGVMGGLDSEVTDATQRILLESAWFEPRSVRRTAKRHDLATESARRFATGIDPEGVVKAADRCAALIAEWAGGRVLEGIIDVQSRSFEPIQVVLRPDRASLVLGAHVSGEEAREILVSLGFEVMETGTKETLQVKIPGFRPDVTREIDLIEEVARLKGYDEIRPEHPLSRLEVPRLARRLVFERAARRALVSAGGVQAVNYAFLDPSDLAKLGVPEGHDVSDLVRIANPINVELSALRSTLLPGLLKSLRNNVNHRAESVFLFEIGTIFKNTPRNEENLPFEQRAVAGVLWGKVHDERWFGRSRTFDFFDAKGSVEAVLAELKVEGSDISWIKSEKPWSNPYATAEVGLDHSKAGWVCELLPDVCEAFDVPWPVYAFELYLDIVGPAGKPLTLFKGLPRYPSSRRDVSMIVDEGLQAREVVEAAMSSGAAHVESVQVFDVYRGEPIPSGKKSMAIAVVYRSLGKSLDSAEIDEQHSLLVAALRDGLGAEIRDT